MQGFPKSPTERGRRAFLRRGVAGLGLVVGAPILARCGKTPSRGRDVSIEAPVAASLPRTSRFDELSPLRPPDALGLRLPDGFTARVVARSGQQVAGTDYVWHAAPDGGATYPLSDGGFIYVSNSESVFTGGASAIRFDGTGRIADAYRILGGTALNCAGGATPWGTWLSCEERDRGTVWECDPTGRDAAVQRLALGSFCHEAAAVDLGRRHVYLTEDEPDGRLYRFTSSRTLAGGRLDLDRGTMHVLRVVSGMSGAVEWLPLSDSNPSVLSTATRAQVPSSTAFAGGEGIFLHGDTLYFTTKGDDRVWRLDVARQTIDVLYDDDTAESPILTGVDNVHVSPAGDVLVAEDGGDLQIVVLTPSGRVKPIVQVVGQDGSEIAGPALDPSRRRLLFSSQRGPSGNPLGTDGITYEIEGPFFV